MLVTTHGIYKNMLEQPHLLIAGATGSGKSVIVNGLIYTAIATDATTQLILIDPKRVELSPYKSLPHTIFYASEPDDMHDALVYAINIINKRYQIMDENHQRKYQGGDIYIVIDEFADLMTTDKKRIMPIIQRIAQIGRAAKVHLIIATQTPIAKVLPTEIKCNFDARIALRTRSAQDSRNILGETGAESLPRYGKCYYMLPEGTSKHEVPYYKDEEIDELVAFLTPPTPSSNQTSAPTSQTSPTASAASAASAYYNYSPSIFSGSTTRT